MENIDYNGNSMLHPMFFKRTQMQSLLLSAYCIVVEWDGNVKCIKNRYAECTMECVKNYIFKKIKLSDLYGAEHDIQRRYFEENIWLLLDE